MKHTKLGSSDLHVSQICLGSMTWGNQNSESDAHSQIEYALDHNINFIDTAEMYAVPPSKDTCGLTEKYIGSWLVTNKTKREDLILATKIAGSGVPWIRSGGKITGKAVQAAVDASLKRLKTDYIDLYQLHWMNRVGPQFGRHWPGMIDYDSMDVNQEKEEHLDILLGLDSCVKAGKIRYCGLSNDTPWGIKEYQRLAEMHDLPRMVSLQNEFSLLHLTDIPHVIETCKLDDIAYLPWSPLAGGALSGKYRNGAKPEGCRWTMQQRNGIFRDTTLSHQAIDAYFAVAQKHQLSLTELALAWVYQCDGITSAIIGATSIAQLEEDINALKVELSPELLAEIDAVIRHFPVPF